MEDFEALRVRARAHMENGQLDTVKEHVYQRLHQLAEANHDEAAKVCEQLIEPALLIVERHEGIGASAESLRQQLMKNMSNAHLITILKRVRGSATDTQTGTLA